MVVAQLDLRGATRDPKDDPVLAAALAGGVDPLVSGDEDLLTLEEYKGVRAIRPKAFALSLGLGAG
jgi:uncharacterized protein